MVENLFRKYTEQGRINRQIPHLSVWFTGRFFEFQVYHLNIDEGILFNYLCGDMFKKYIYIAITALLMAFQANAQFAPGGTGTPRMGTGTNQDDEENGPAKKKKDEKKNKPKIPSIIKTWSVADEGSFLKPSLLDTTLTFYQNYIPFNKRSISSTFTGNNGGAYISNDFFEREPNSDFFFIHSFDAYWLTPSQIQYINTTTPYSTLDYSQSENRVEHNETRFNVLFSQNVNRKLNFQFIFNSTKSTGQYLFQENKFHNIALVSSYTGSKFVSHSNIIFNRLTGQENGGLDSLSNGQMPPLMGTLTNNFPVHMDDATNQIRNNNFFTVNEYRVGKTIESKPDTAGRVKDIFIPRVGFIYQLEYSYNVRKFNKANANTFFENNYSNSSSTHDSLSYGRLTNILQIKFYEAPDRKFTFGKRVYIGNDQLAYNMSTSVGYYPKNTFNSFAGGAIFRNEGKFWQWEADGRIYFTGYRAGQTELNGFINKPLRIGRDTTSLRIEGSLKSLVAEYFDNYFYSNHFQWTNSFSNINIMNIRSSINSQELKTTVGVNYSLIGNYIYNNTKALPQQAGTELIVLSAYLNKDFSRKHWLVRTQLLAQKASKEDYIHLPIFAGYVSMNYLLLISKVLHTQIGIDTRYNSAFYADAYEPATARFYLQDKRLIGNYPYIDVHANLKLKRTRFFFIFMNTTSAFLDNYYVAPDYPYYLHTFRFGLSWSFYD